MELKDITAIFGSALSAASILFAVYTFKRNDDRASFARFRLALVDLRNLVRKLDSQLSQPVFNEVSIEIAKELESIFTDDISVDELVQALKDENKLNYVRQAIHQGIRQAPALKEIEQIIDQLEKLPIEFSEQFPVVSALISRLNFYCIRTARGILSPAAFNHVIGDAEAVEKLLVPELKNVDNTHLAYREIALLIGSVPHSLLEGKFQSTIDDIAVLVRILVSSFSTLSDAALREQSKRQKGLAKQVNSIDKETAIEDAFEYFRLLKHVFAADWETIIEAKTRIIQNSTKT